MHVTYHITCSLVFSYSFRFLSRNITSAYSAPRRRASPTHLRWLWHQEVVPCRVTLPVRPPRPARSDRRLADRLTLRLFILIHGGCSVYATPGGALSERRGVRRARAGCRSVSGLLSTPGVGELVPERTGELWCGLPDDRPVNVATNGHMTSSGRHVSQQTRCCGVSVRVM